MLPTSLAIGWPLWRRHRWGLAVVLGHLACSMAAAFAVIAARIEPETVNGILCCITIALLGSAAYLMAVFSFGFDADMNARESCFPAGLFRLPVRTGALVGWPMAYGAAATLLLWLITAEFILRPWLDLLNIQLPLWWPATLAVATQAWFQTLLWVPLGLPFFRIILAAVLIPGLIAIAQFSVESGVSQGFLVGLFSSFAGLAWMAGYLGIRHARYGDIPNWEVIFRPFHRLGQRLPRRRRPFAAGARAQVWFERRRTGLSLPVLTMVVLPFVLLPLLFGKNDAIPAPRTFLTALLIPVFLAGLAGTTVSGNHPWVKDYYGVAPFTASLPMSTAGLVGAKLKAAAMSTLVTWTLVSVTLVLAATTTGNLEELASLRREWLGEQPPVKIAVGAVAAVSFLILWTWKRLVNSVLLGLTGRKWIIQGSIFAAMAGLVILTAVAGWIYKNPEYHATVLAVLPWLLGAWILCRLLAAGWALRLIIRQNLMKDRTVLRLLLAWLLLGFALFGSFAWIFPGELVPPHYVAFAVLLVMPMAHLAATPLALAWNRHR